MSEAKSHVTRSGCWLSLRDHRGTLGSQVAHAEAVDWQQGEVVAQTVFARMCLRQRSQAKLVYLG